MLQKVDECSIDYTLEKQQKLVGVATCFSKRRSREYSTHTLSNGGGPKSSGCGEEFLNGSWL